MSPSTLIHRQRKDLTETRLLMAPINVGQNVHPYHVVGDFLFCSEHFKGNLCDESSPLKIDVVTLHAFCETTS